MRDGNAAGRGLFAPFGRKGKIFSKNFRKKEEKRNLSCIYKKHGFTVFHQKSVRTEDTYEGKKHRTPCF